MAKKPTVRRWGYCTTYTSGEGQGEEGGEGGGGMWLRVLYSLIVVVMASTTETSLLTQRNFLPSIRGEVKYKKSQGGDETNRQNKVEAIIKRAASYLDRECDVYVRFGATVIEEHCTVYNDICKERVGMRVSDGGEGVRPRVGARVASGGSAREGRWRMRHTGVTYQGRPFHPNQGEGRKLGE